jgi:hypothetical protein
MKRTCMFMENAIMLMGMDIIMLVSSLLKI